jgi:tyrosyl-tRNA synthetase
MTQPEFKPVEEQLAYLKKGVAEIIPEAELIAKLENSLKTGKPLRVYLGVDPTAPDLHLGHTVVLRKLKHFQDLGHTAIFLIGDFSAMIGDPTGQSETRPPLTREQVDANAKTYLEQVYKILDREKTEVRYNSEWLAKLTSYEIIRLTAKYPLARMLEREDFRARLAGGWKGQLFQPSEETLRSREGDEPAPALPSTGKASPVKRPSSLAIHELLYPLLTALDAVELKSDVELGATEQKFNLLVHREIQREYGLPGQAILTMPILVGLDGHRKMSKSLGNYIGITEPPSEMFGKIMSIPDELMWSYYELVTDRTEAEIQEMRKSLTSAPLPSGPSPDKPPMTMPPVPLSDKPPMTMPPEPPLNPRSLLHLPHPTHPMEIKMDLAREVVATFHGEEAGRKAAEYFRRVFRARLAPDEMKEIRIKRVPGGAFVIFPKLGDIEERITLPLTSGTEKWSKLLAAIKEVGSATEVERIMKQRGFEINGETVQDPTRKLDLDRPNSYEVRVGKKKFLRIVVE